jgi:poly(3-hydroxybutyrate) depolymerase
MLAGPALAGSVEDSQRLKAIVPKSYARSVAASLLTIDGKIDEPTAAKADGAVNSSSAAVDALAKYLEEPRDKRGAIDKQDFASVALSREHAARAAELLWKDHAASIRRDRTDQMKARELSIGKYKMPFWYKTFGEKPDAGRAMFISMHGGGGAPKQVNDRQYENQKRLYQLKEGVYVVPRAPTDTWNLWHQAHIDNFFDRLIEDLVVFENVDPDRIYIMGYSAGGDGVYQLAPRMADRLAAAAMMAGHPNETSPLGLRNLPFAIHVGANDSGYGRNQVARQWQQKLAELHAADALGYTHVVRLHEGKGHWMDREDAVAIGWMEQYKRQRNPNRVVWKQDDVSGTRFYWLAAEPKTFGDRALVVVNRDGQKFDIDTKDYDRLMIRLSDEMLDLDKPVSITAGGKTVFDATVKRTVANLAKTLGERGDPKGMFSGEATVNLTSATPAQAGK